VAFVITEPCIGEKNSACSDVCPADCIRIGDADQQGFIDPDECIDCGACESACPVKAIYPQDTVPAEWRHFIDLNRERAQA
jgi:NAD-dependent dihydropyrimidine dehydrogenase PreA subunit